MLYFLFIPLCGIAITCSSHKPTRNVLHIVAHIIVKSSIQVFPVHMNTLCAIYFSRIKNLSWDKKFLQVATFNYNILFKFVLVKRVLFLF